MSCRRLFLLLLLLAAPAFAGEPKKDPAGKEPASPIIGNWLGTLKVGDTTWVRLAGGISGERVLYSARLTFAGQTR